VLINIKEISTCTKPQDPKQEPVVSSCKSGQKSFQGNPDIILTRSIKELVKGENIHFYSWANFNLVRLILHLMKFTGPAHLLMTSYSFSQDSIEKLSRQLKAGEILSLKVLIDHRVKVMSPKPFQMLSSCFDYRCTSLHAKVALIWNDQYRISVVTSQNATDNPKLERGIIHTDSEIFDFDYKILSDEFDKATT